MLLWWWTYVIVYLFKPIECMTSRVIPKVNYGLWLWYVNVSSSSLKIYTILVGNVDNEGGNGHLMWRVDSLEKTLMLGGIGAGGEGDDRGWDGWMASLSWWMWVWVNSGSWWWTGRPGVVRFMGSQRVDTTEWLNWTECMCGSRRYMVRLCSSPLILF